MSAEILKGCVGHSAPMGLLEISSAGYNFPFQSISLQIAAGAMEKEESVISVGGVCGGLTEAGLCLAGPQHSCVSLCDCSMLKSVACSSVTSLTPLLCVSILSALGRHISGPAFLHSQYLSRPIDLQKNESQWRVSAVLKHQG